MGHQFLSQGNDNDKQDENGETVASITDSSLGIAGLFVTAGTNCKRTADQPICPKYVPNKLKVSLFQNQILMCQILQNSTKQLQDFAQNYRKWSNQRCNKGR